MMDPSHWDDASPPSVNIILETATMVANLLVVPCGDQRATPIVNIGSLNPRAVSRSDHVAC